VKCDTLKRYMVLFLSERNEDWDWQIQVTKDSAGEALEDNIVKIATDNQSGTGVDAVVVLDTHTGERLVEWQDPGAVDRPWSADSSAASSAETEEWCPKCNQRTVKAKSSGVACVNPGCDYWFCF